MAGFFSLLRRLYLTAYNWTVFVGWYSLFTSFSSYQFISSLLPLSLRRRFWSLSICAGFRFCILFWRRWRNRAMKMSTMQPKSLCFLLKPLLCWRYYNFGPKELILINYGDTLLFVLSKNFKFIVGLIWSFYFCVLGFFWCGVGLHGVLDSSWFGGWVICCSWSLLGSIKMEIVVIVCLWIFSLSLCFFFQWWRVGAVSSNGNLATDRFKVVPDLGHLMELPWG